jgi:hypothetical protein
VTAHTRGRDSLQEGPADVEAERAREVIVESREWTRDVEVVAPP